MKYGCYEDCTLAYDVGYKDGWDETCEEIFYYDEDMVEELMWVDIC